VIAKPLAVGPQKPKCYPNLTIMPKHSSKSKLDIYLNIMANLAIFGGSYAVARALLDPEGTKKELKELFKWFKGKFVEALKELKALYRDLKDVEYSWRSQFSHLLFGDRQRKKIVKKIDKLTNTLISECRCREGKKVSYLENICSKFISTKRLNRWFPNRLESLSDEAQEQIIFAMSIFDSLDSAGANARTPDEVIKEIDALISTSSDNMFDEMSKEAKKSLGDAWTNIHSKSQKTAAGLRTLFTNVKSSWSKFLNKKDGDGDEDDNGLGGLEYSDTEIPKTPRINVIERIRQKSQRRKGPLYAPGTERSVVGDAREIFEASDDDFKEVLLSDKTKQDDVENNIADLNPEAPSFEIPKKTSLSMHPDDLSGEDRVAAVKRRVEREKAEANKEPVIGISEPEMVLKLLANQVKMPIRSSLSKRLNAMQMIPTQM